MTEKLKVSREVADAIEKLNSNFNQIMKIHSSFEKWGDGAKQVLNSLTTKELAIALIVGYEVEMTPHEVIAKKYRGAKHGREIALEAGENDTALFNRGVMAGIKHTLRTLEITVEGVNDHDNS